MKNKKTGAQILAGFLPIFILWIIGGVFGDAYFLFPEDYIFSGWGTGLEYVSVIVVYLMPVFLLISAIVGKRYKFKVLYPASVFAIILPIFAYDCFNFFTNDGNIFTWIFAFTLAIPLLPFGKASDLTFRGIDTYLYANQERFLDCRLLMFSFAVVIVVSFIIYVAVGPKKTTQKTPEQFIDVSNYKKF